MLGKRGKMKNIPFTLCVPEDTLRDLFSYVPARKRSKFISDLIYVALKTHKDGLLKEFKSSSRDTLRKSEIDLWSDIQGDL